MLLSRKDILFFGNWNWGHLLLFFGLLFFWCLQLIVFHEFAHNAIKERLFVDRRHIVFQSQGLSFYCSFLIWLGTEYRKRMFHLIDLKQVFYQIQAIHSLRIFSQFLDFGVFCEKGGGLNKWGLTLLPPDSWASIVLNTDDLIWALMLLR